MPFHFLLPNSLLTIVKKITIKIQKKIYPLFNVKLFHILIYNFIMEKILVLNFDYTPLNVTTIKRGFNLVYKGKAEIVKSSENPILTTYEKYVRPLIIRLLDYVKFKIKQIRVSRSQIYKRDNSECVYCGSDKCLTIDHVMPKSRGGNFSWGNLVTCCFKCNIKKGNKTPSEAGMVMKVDPYCPSLISSAFNGPMEKIWEDFQKSFFV